MEFKTKVQSCIKILLFIVVTMQFLSCDLFKEEDKNWYKGAIFYEIWVKSFADSNDANSIGDINGIISKLDYLNDGNPKTDDDLGITAIKLSPIFDCAYKSENPHLNMHGYDSVNFYSVNNLFGDIKLVKKLLNEAHKRGIKVIFDFVPNHTSTEHPWFINASTNGDKYDWYVWTNYPDEAWKPPYGEDDDNDATNDRWKIWKWNDGTQNFYYTTSPTNLPKSPLADLNFRNSEVKKEIFNIAEFWLDLGFDGLRIDMAKYLIENGPEDQQNCIETHNIFKELREFIDSKYNNKKVLIAEAWDDKEIIKDYYGNGKNEFDMCFDFPYAFEINNAIENEPTSLNDLVIYEKENYPEGFRSATFESNHDDGLSRPYSLYSNNLKKCALSAALNILSPGTPFIYYGNEIGLIGSKKYGDINLRKFMNWKEAQKQQNLNNSLFSWYKNLIKVRKNFNAFENGTYLPVNSSDQKVLSYIISNKKQNILMVYNCSNENKEVILNYETTGITERKIYNVIGENKKIQFTNNSILEIKNIKPYDILVLKIGGKKAELVCNNYDTIIGGAEEGYFDPVSYDSMYVRGSMNNWQGTNPLKKDENRVWSVILELNKGYYEYKYEISGTSNWEIDFGDNDKNGICDMKGSNLNYNADKDGKYLFTFNELTMEYKVKLIE